ncbi:MAG: hypothetical protein GC204_08750 [Chloroflexi bacterium]|nr:hypothetical protein [Chloroflexota bacterium]
MALEDESLEALFERWKTVLGTNPSQDERDRMKALPHYRVDNVVSLQLWNDERNFRDWHDQLPPYYRDKADVMLEILTRLKAEKPFEWVRSEIREDIPQLAYFLFARHLELFVLKAPLRLKELVDLQIEPKWLADLLQKGVTLEEIDALAQQVAWETLARILSVTDGYSYGDLPKNAPRPRIVASALDIELHPRYLDGIHEFVEDTVLQPSSSEDHT